MMVGGAMRKVSSLYQRASSRISAPSDAAEGLSERRGRGRGTTQVPPQDDEEVQEEVQEEAHEEAQEEDEEAQQTGSGSTASGSSVYLRGPTSLPQRPILRERRPMIRPEGE